MIVRIKTIFILASNALLNRHPFAAVLVTAALQERAQGDHSELPTHARPTLVCARLAPGSGGLRWHQLHGCNTDVVVTER